LWTIVPTTHSTSLWRGDQRGISAPKRARSKCAHMVDMNSIAQHAVTNGYWNTDQRRAQAAI